MSNAVQSEASNLPIPVINAVLRAASKEASASKEALSISEAEEEIWPDTCLGLDSPGEVCAQMQVPGYKVTVEAGVMFLFYRTDKSGSTVRLEKKAPIIT
jgi:hypothetical protein